MSIIDGATDMGTASVLTDTFKIAIVGPSGSGKSWLAASCASAEEPAFHFDWDARKQSIAGKPHVTSKTYQDVDFPNKMPTAWANFMVDLLKLEQAKQKGTNPYKWYIYDSATFGSIASMNNILYNTGSMRREVRAAGRVTYVPGGFDAYKAEMADVLGAWQRLLCLGNLIVTFHEGKEKDDASTSEKQVFTGKYGVQPPRYQDMVALFNDTWRIKALGPGRYEVQTQPDSLFTAKNTMLLDATETPDIRKMMAKYQVKAKKP
jgi:hypothetical protein